MGECHCGKDGHALNSINCPAHGKGWRTVEDRPDWFSQPGRQFIMLVGSCTHHGATWARAWAGEAFLRKPGAPDELLQYRATDIARLCADGDIDPHTARVTHWMPVAFPPLPPSPHPPAHSGPAEPIENKGGGQ